MLATPTIDTLRQALAPVEVLRGEHSLLEKWLRESFAAIDALHGELTDWQRDLTRQQAALDQREAAVAEASELRTAEAVAEVEDRLSQMRDDVRQLEEENAEQLQTMELLEHQLAVAKAELRLANKHSEELSATLEAERDRAAEEHRQWTAELREMRKMMELAMKSRVSSPPGDDLDATGEDVAASGEETGAVARAAELRRRAESRRTARSRPD